MGRHAGPAQPRRDADPDHPRHGRGRPAVRPDRDRRPRQDHRARHAARPALAPAGRARARAGARPRPGRRVRRARLGRARGGPRGRRPLHGAALRRVRPCRGDRVRRRRGRRSDPARAEADRGNAGGRLRPPDRARAAMRASVTRSFLALLGRDVWVTVRHDPVAFLAQALLQPVFFLFIFGRVLPDIGAAQGGYGTALLPGVLALTLVLTALQATALPLVIEFSFTKEIEDRLLAPVPVWAVAVEKIVIAAARGIIAALLILPLGALILPGGIDLGSASWLGF